MRLRNCARMGKGDGEIIFLSLRPSLPRRCQRQGYGPPYTRGRLGVPAGNQLTINHNLFGKVFRVFVFGTALLQSACQQKRNRIFKFNGSLFIIAKSSNSLTVYQISAIAQFYIN